ncbi:MFS transporter [Mycobacterium sp. ITM-2016-00318]|uniref:MFS transporter n=1 Tax=Mycobacterium sp. ITM-2016-00318 TaxID=2099693 RepID=UPI000CF9D185|nr:MFS transporter [Mycobacterium sp. ITM-2016-00318]WNG92911.1 MFS transporter [Mycobacterium sp. ITM-2016-00318]
MADARAPLDLWRSVRGLPHFWRLLELRTTSQFGDGLFQAGLAGGLLFNPERAAGPWELVGAFAVLYLPYSVLGPFAGALLDRWDRRTVLIGANAARVFLVLGIAALLASGAGDLSILFGALIANGFTRFVSSGLSAALPDVVPRGQVVTMNSVATATGGVATFLGAGFMLASRPLLGSDDKGSAAVLFIVVVPVLLALLLSVRFPRHVLGPHESARAIHGSVAYAVATGWLHGARTVLAVRTVAATLGGLATHRMVLGINSMLVFVMVRHVDTHSVAGFGTAALFFFITGIGSFIANVITPSAVGRWGRYRTANGALLLAAVMQLGGAGLQMPMMLLCGFLLGLVGQVVKLCADTAMQIDVDDALRGHMFAVQDALFWMSFIVALTAAAAVIPADGYSPGLVVAGSVLYLLGFALHAGVARRARPPG